MIITKKFLDRRAFLRGTGAMMALPLLDAMAPALTAQARTAANPVRRFGAVYIPHGKIHAQWVPTKTGTDFEVTPILKPLEHLRTDICVISRLDGPKDVVGGGHATAPAMWLTGVSPKKTEGVDLRNGTSIDQLIAKQIGQTTLFPSLEVATEDFSGYVGACDVGFSCAYMNTISWQNPTSPLPMEINPRVVFDRMFGGQGSAAQRAERLQMRRSLLDSVMSSASRLANDLGPSDRIRMDQYLEAVREIERRIQRQMAITAVSETSYAGAAKMPAGIPEQFEEHVGLLFDLLAVAFQADITRVFTFMMARDLHNRTYPQVGINEPHHALSHHQDKPEKMARFAKVNTYHVALFGKFLEKLRSLPDGEGTLLDHSIILYGSGMGNPNVHSHVSLPYLLAGSGAGRLTTGRHIAAPEHDPIGNLLLSLGNKFDVPIEQFGLSTKPLEL